MMKAFTPTPDPDLNEVLHDLVSGVQAILGENFLGAYLSGSYAHGGWDAYSDVDFNIVIARDLHWTELDPLKAVHAGIFTRDLYGARHLEGAYFPVEVLADLDRTDVPLWYLDNGSLNFERATHDNTLVNRWVLREKGVILAGPPPAIWIPPVPEQRLKAEVWATMRDWGGEIQSGAYVIGNRWAQVFAVMMYCRMLHSLASGAIQGKPAGAVWGKVNLAPRWIPLIDDALSARPNQYEKVWQPADPEKVARTLDFVAYALDEGRTTWGMSA